MDKENTDDHESNLTGACLCGLSHTRDPGKWCHRFLSQLAEQLSLVARAEQQAPQRSRQIPGTMPCRESSSLKECDQYVHLPMLYDKDFVTSEKLYNNKNLSLSNTSGVYGRMFQFTLIVKTLIEDKHHLR